jgi:hypothetical protein
VGDKQPKQKFCIGQQVRVIDHKTLIQERKRDYPSWVSGGMDRMSGRVYEIENAFFAHDVWVYALREGEYWFRESWLCPLRWEEGTQMQLFEPTGEERA